MFVMNTKIFAKQLTFVCFPFLYLRTLFNPNPVYLNKIKSTKDFFLRMDKGMQNRGLFCGSKDKMIALNE